MGRVRRIDPLLLSRARELRARSTDAEQLLWRQLRNRRLLGHRFRRQHPLGPYVVDFYCPRARLAVEVDGDQHGEPGQVEHDRRRTAWLREQGVEVLRFGNRDVLRELEGSW